MPRTPRILVIGGGIGGLAAALALERQRVEVIVCEQSPQLSEIGAGLDLAPTPSRRSARSASRRRSPRSARNPNSGHPQLAERPHHLAHRRRALSATVRRAASHPPSRRSAGGAGRRARATPTSAWARAASRSNRDDAQRRARALPTAARSRPTSSSAPTAFIPPVRRQPVRRRGAAFHRLHLLARAGAGRRGAARYHYQRRHACGWARTATSCITACGAASSSTSSRIIDSDAWTEESWTQRVRAVRGDADLCALERALPAALRGGERWYKWALYDREPPERWSKGRATLWAIPRTRCCLISAKAPRMAIEDGYVLARHGRARRTISARALAALRGAAHAARAGARCSARAPVRARRTIWPRRGAGSSAT